MTLFDDVKVGPPIEVFALNKGYTEDSCPNKCNLGVGGNNIYVNLFNYLHKIFT